MKINKTKILIYIEETGVMEAICSEYSIHMVSGDTLSIIGVFECDGELLIPTVIKGMSGFQVRNLLISHKNVLDFLKGDITKRKLRKLIQQLGTFNDNVPTS